MHRWRISFLELWLVVHAHRHATPRPSLHDERVPARVVLMGGGGGGGGGSRNSAAEVSSPLHPGRVK